MQFDFYLKHENSKLLQLYILQAVVIIGVFSLFFSTLGFSFLYAAVSGLICFLAIATLFWWLQIPFFILPMISGAVYVPTKPEAIETMLKLAKPKSGEKMIDLGSGDGRVVAAFAHAGVAAVGVELNPSLIRRAEALAKAEKLTHARFLWQSYWDENLEPYDIVTIYAYPSMMKALGKKLRQELRPGARVLSNAFPIPGWEVVKEENGVFLYQIK